MNLDILVGRPLRDALRSLGRSRGFAATAVLSLGGAIGLACSVWAVIASTFFTPLPYHDADGLVQFWQTAGPGVSQPQDYLAPERMEAWVDAPGFRTLGTVAATGMGPTLVLRGSDGAVKVESAPLLGDWFGTLGVEAARGRVLTLDDLREGAPPAAVVSDAFWREGMGGGDLEPVVLSDVTYTVVGVMPPSFAPTALVWVSVRSLPDGLRPVAYAGVGRLRPGSTPEEAAAEVEQLASVQVREDSARYSGLGATTRRMGDWGRRANERALWMLAGVVLAVLLLALNNLTVLTLVRARARDETLAVRAALGASRWELGRGLAAEGALLGLVGAAVGLALAYWGKDVAAGFLGPDLGRPALGPGTVALAVGLGVLVAVVIGVEPMRRIGSLDLRELLQRRAGGARGTPGERRMRQVLVAAQVGICLVLISVAMVLTAAYQAYASLDVGFDARRVVEVFPDWELRGIGPDEQWRIADGVALRLARVPGVEATSAWRQIGEDFPARPEFDAVTDGPPVDLDRFDGLYRFYEVRDGFFATLGLEMVEGRRFTAEDGRGREPVAVVTERGARAWWPGGSALGRQIKLGQAGMWMTVVGVVGDLHQLDQLGRVTAVRSRPAMPLLFVPWGQFETEPAGWRPFGCCAGVRIGARAGQRSGPVVQGARRILAQEAPDLPILSIGTLHSVQMGGFAGDSIARTARLVSVAMAVAFILALLGVVGVVSEAVARRTREIGVRVALGAGAGHLAWTVARESVYTTLAGLVGGALTLAAMQAWMSKVVFDWTVQRLGPEVLSAQILGAAAAAMLVATLAAVLLTARRALGVDPVEALRAD